MPTSDGAQNTKLGAPVFIDAFSSKSPFFFLFHVPKSALVNINTFGLLVQLGLERVVVFVVLTPKGPCWGGDQAEYKFFSSPQESPLVCRLRAGGAFVLKLGVHLCVKKAAFSLLPRPLTVFCLRSM